LVATVTVTVAIGPAAAAAPEGVCWRRVPSPNGNEALPNYLLGVDGILHDDVWAVGYDQTGVQDEALIEHWDGSRWSVNAQILIGNGDTRLSSVDALTETNVWAVGSYSTVLPLVEHWDGTGWFVSPTPVPGSFNALASVSAVSASNIWAVGVYEVGVGPNLDLAFHYDGASWTQADVPNPGAISNVLNGVSARTTNDVWAVGSAVDETFTSTPLTVHWNGVRWSLVPSPAIPGGVLNGVVAIGQSNVWAVGTSPDGGFSIHWDGTSWTQVPMPQVSGQVYLHGVDASYSGDVWAVGEASSEDWTAVAFRWNGSTWRVAQQPQGRPPTHFLGVGVLNRGSVWAVGYWQSNIDSTLTEHLATC